MRKHNSNTQKVPKRRATRRRSAPSRGDTSPSTSLGEVYLETFSPPALASTSEVYMEVYASVRAILDRYNWRHATTAVRAAWDAATQHVEQKISNPGGGSS